jgi:bifunctional DNase/RNase
MTRQRQPALREMVLDEPSVALLDRERALITLRDTHYQLRLTVPAAATDALALELSSETRLPLWPFPIDLLARTLEALGVLLDCVVLERLADDQVAGSLNLVLESQTYAVKARAVDALLLGLRMGTPLFVAEELFQPAGCAP